MAYDPIIDCLSALTDYREFERFCCALLGSTLYPRLEPLGGTNDGGRDAIIRDDGQGNMIAFAYSAREDWRTKLISDAERIRQAHPQVGSLVFATTAALSAKSKDQAVEAVRDRFGWPLAIFDVEHLRQLLLSREHLIARHPAIFHPELFKPAPGPVFARRFLEENAPLCASLGGCGADLANQVSTELFNELAAFVNKSEVDRLRCPDAATLNLLERLQFAVAHVWCIISDDHYTPTSWGRKFDNLERRYVDVQAILRSKREGMSEALAEFNQALQALHAHALN